MSSGTLCIALLVALQLLMLTANDCSSYEHAGEIASIPNCTKSPSQINEELNEGPRYCT